MALSEKEFNAIQGSGLVERIEIDGVVYTSKPVHDVRKAEPEHDALAVTTLAGLVEFIDSHEIPAGTVAHVISYQQVQLISQPWGRFKQRDVFVEAQAAWPAGLVFDQFQNSEIFNIRLQSLFVRTEACATLLAAIGNLKVENIQTSEDNGVTQEVTVKTGAVRVSRVTLPNPVMLAPFRTFRELNQPESPFVLRVREGKDGAAECALFEADGGTWKLEAVDRIKEWLGEHLPENIKVIG